MSVLLFVFLGLAQASEPDDMPQRLYNAYCINCHTKDEKVVDFDQSTPEEKMIEKIRDGERGMPTYSWLFDDEDLKSIIEYMKTLPQ